MLFIHAADPMPLTYRNVTPADLGFVIAMIVEDSVVETGDDPADAAHPDYVDALAAIDADPNQEMLVVEEDGVPVGCFQLSYLPGLMRRGAWRGQIEVVHVAEAHRNRGLGGQMMRWAIDRCRERNCAMVQLTSNKKRLDAHRFYERLGFLKSHEGFKLYL
jgi:GNAT superfamily N-acetyltransferase